jgi:hypothetical protein
MSVLGHRSSTMGLVYARITDTTVLEDYKMRSNPAPASPAPQPKPCTTTSYHSSHWTG